MASKEYFPPLKTSVSLYSGRAGGLLEEQQRTQRKFAEMSESELAEILQHHGWAIVGPSPL
ncbi:MAG: hypothetical protein WA709_35320 [Stellaceae bacterium]